MDGILARLRANDSQQSTPTQKDLKPHKTEHKSMDKLLANLNGRNQALKKQQLDLKDESESDVQKDEDHSSGSDLFTPATESFDALSAGDTSEAAAARADAEEILRVKQELAAAKSVITRQEQELSETRNLKHTMDQAIGPPSEVDFGNRTDITEQTISHLQSAFNASARPFTSRNNSSWHPQEDSRSDNSDALSAGSYNRARGIWNHTTQPMFTGALNAAAGPPLFNDPRSGQGSSWTAPYGNQDLLGQGNFRGGQRVFSGPSPQNYGFDSRFTDDLSGYNQSNGVKRSMSQYNRTGPGYLNRSTPFGSYPAGLAALNTAPVAPLSLASPLGYQPRPIGSSLSPTGSDFTTGSLPAMSSPWSPVNFISFTPFA